MKHIFEQKVYYADTDSYGVVWHGTYLRWMEIGRVEILNLLGVDLVECKKNDIMLPVTNLNIRYKSSAKLDDEIIIETAISQISPITITFLQTIKNKETGKIYTVATVEGVAVNGQGKIYRRMPDIIKQKLEKAIESV